MKPKAIAALFLLSSFIPPYSASDDDILEFMPAIIAGIKSEPVVPVVPVVPDGVTLNQNFTFTRDFFGDLLIFGEIVNNTNSHIEFVRVNANIFNGNQLVDTDFTFVSRSIMPPRTTSCFRMFTDHAGSFTQVLFEPIQFSSTSNRLPSLSISNVTRQQDFSNNIEIFGLVTNNSPSRAEFVNVISTFYGSNDRVIDCDFNFVNSTDLNSGQTSAFNVNTITSNSSVSRFVLQTDGDL